VLDRLHKGWNELQRRRLRRHRRVIRQEAPPVRDGVRRGAHVQLIHGALTAAANELKANGVEGVTSQASVDPIAELKTVPGVDTSKLQTFETEATAAAAEAESQSPPPPPPPPPPPKNLIQDDDDAVTRVRALAPALLAAALALAALA